MCKLFSIIIMAKINLLTAEYIFNKVYVEVRMKEREYLLRKIILVDLPSLFP